MVTRFQCVSATTPRARGRSVGAGPLRALLTSRPLRRLLVLPPLSSATIAVCVLVQLARLILLRRPLLTLPALWRLVPRRVRLALCRRLLLLLLPPPSRECRDCDCGGCGGRGGGGQCGGYCCGGDSSGHWQLSG